jgi:hypothetical protein
MLTLNKSIKTHNFRVATSKDLNKIMEFIRKYWEPNKHILGVDKKYFKYEFEDKNKINFFVAENNRTKKIDVIHGFIPYSKVKKKVHICGSISRVNPNCQTPFLGIITMNKMFEYLKPKSYCGIGTNPITMAPLVKKFFKRYVGIMDHYYYLNPNKQKFKVAFIKKQKKKLEVSKIRLNKNFYFKKVSEFNFIKKHLKNMPINDLVPRKDNDYFKKKYFLNPYFKYDVYIFSKDKKFNNPLILVCRIQKKFNEKILRIIDIIGNFKDLKFLKIWIPEIILNKNYEYIDLLCSGFRKSIIENLGFVKICDNDDNIIPNYFEPFVRKNVQVWYEKSNKELILFKGDADADRPRFSRN